VSAIRGSIRVAAITAREVLAAGRGVPWLLAVVLGIALARASGDAPSEGPALRAAIHLGLGAVAALAIAAFAPVALFARKDGRPTPTLVAVRPLGGLARAAGPVLGAVGACVALQIAFAVTAPLAVGAPPLSLRSRIGDLAIRLRDPSGAIEVEGRAPAGAALRLAPRIGWASAYGESAETRFDVEIRQGTEVRERRIALRGRDRATLPLAEGAFRASVRALGESPVVAWPEGSVALLGERAGVLSAAIRVGIAAVLGAVALAGAAGAFAAAFERPVAALASASLVIVAIASPSPALREWLALSPLLDLEGWFAGELAPVDLGSAVRAAILGIGGTGIAALLFARR